jgi:hypothetical protein
MATATWLSNAIAAAKANGATVAETFFTQNATALLRLGMDVVISICDSLAKGEKDAAIILLDRALSQQDIEGEEAVGADATEQAEIDQEQLIADAEAVAKSVITIIGMIPK